MNDATLESNLRLKTPAKVNLSWLIGVSAFTYCTLLPAYAAENVFNGSGGEKFMEESFSTKKDEQIAARYIYGAYASIHHGKFGEATQWIKTGRYKAAAQLLKARIDENYLLELVNAEAKRQKFRVVAKSEVEFQILNSYLQSFIGSEQVGLEILKRVVLNFPKYQYVEALKARIKAIEFDSTIVPWESPPDVVLPGVRRNDLPKWRLDKFPLKVFIPTDDACAKIKGYRAGDALLFKSCFEIWQKQSAGRVKFVFVPTASKADFTCAWTNEQKDLTLPDAVGVCWQHSDSKRYMRFAEIKVLTFSEKIFGKIGAENLLRKNILTEVCLHEIGHGLGLNHSTGENDVMTAHIHENPLVMLTKRDVGTINTLYTTNVNELIAAAFESVCSDKYDAAEASLNKILTLVPNDQQTRESVCMLQVKMATNLMSEGKYELALKHFIKAQKLLNGKESQKIRDAVLKNLLSCYLKTGNESAAREIDKQYNFLPKPVQNSASFLDRYGLRTDSIPHYEKALADAPGNLEIREKFCHLLVVLAADELKENHDEEAIRLLLKAKSMLEKDMSQESISEVYSSLRKTYNYCQRYREADDVYKEELDVQPKSKETEWRNTTEQNLSSLIAASKSSHPSDWVQPEANKIMTEKITRAYDQYVHSLRQAAIQYKIKEECNWATVLVIRSKQYAAKGVQHPLGKMQALRYALVLLTNESAVIGIDTGLPLIPTEK